MEIINVYEARNISSLNKPVEVVTGESMTVPNQALSIRDIIQRFTLGNPVSGGRSVYFDDIEEVDETLRPDFDLSDVSRIKNEILNNQQLAREEQLLNATKSQNAEASASRDDKRRNEVDEQRVEGKAVDSD